MACTCTFDYVKDGNAFLGTRTSPLCDFCVGVNKDFEDNTKKRELEAKLYEIDLKAIRPLMEADTSKIAELNAEKAVIRQQLDAVKK